MHDSYSLIHYKEVLTHYCAHYTLVYFKDTAIEILTGPGKTGLIYT